MRDLWELSIYLDLRQILGDVQDPRATDPVLSNACEHSAAYCTAITLMSLPTFFMETHTLDPADRKPVADLLNVYKQHRSAMLDGMVHPIGDRPDGSRFTGFQCHHASTQSGYLTLFRELDCPQSQGQWDLVGLPNHAKLKLTDLLTGQSSEAMLDDGQLTLSLESAADFRFIRYEILSN
ncbi:MAG: hypothetical protein ACF8OB_16115 [Phycisphaeraceae bacterium JB051]